MLNRSRHIKACPLDFFINANLRKEIKKKKAVVTCSRLINLRKEKNSGNMQQIIFLNKQMHKVTHHENMPTYKCLMSDKQCRPR